MITSDRRPARTRNTTIIVVLGPINAVAATPWVDFRVGEPIRTPPIRGWLGRMSERGLAPARPIVSLGPRSRRARNRRVAEPSLPETVLAQRRDSGFPAGPRYRPGPSAARSLTQGTALQNQPPQTQLQNVDFEGRTKVFVSLFQIRRQHIFDPFHECTDSARQIAPMCYDE
jgi:hypothetical protein